jgi:acyl-coenzyme A thioesterase PaaI-like protein
MSLRPRDRQQRKPWFRQLTAQLRRVVGTRAWLLLNLYPPYLGANIRLRRAGSHAERFEVEMRLRAWNQNYFGTHFGGSLYSMCDPFFALILTENLGDGYVVWDKAATIRFLRPARGLVRVCFEIPRERLAEVRQAADTRGRTELELTTDIVDEAERPVARVLKVLSVQRRRVS